MKFACSIAAAALGLAAAGGAIAGDAAQGRAKASICQGCHGIEGFRTVYPSVYNVPRLGGQHPEYIVKALKAYQSGAREHGTMRAIAASLSEKDMEDLAAYYASAQPAVAKK